MSMRVHPLVSTARQNVRSSTKAAAAAKKTAAALAATEMYGKAESIAKKTSDNRSPEVSATNAQTCGEDLQR